MKRLTLLLGVVMVGALACGGDGGGGACDSADDCASGERCRDGRCELAPVDDRDAGLRDGAVDAGTDGGAIDGRRCTSERPCPSGYVCEEGACALDCGAQARCDGTCCGDGDVCYLGACTTPGAHCGGGAGACIATGSCGEDEQCDPSLGRCLPRAVDRSCELRPESDFTPALLWAWTGSSAHPTYQHVIATPAVADLDGDGASDIVVPVTDRIPGSLGKTGILCALSGLGDCAGGPRELWCTSPIEGAVDYGAAVAIGRLEPGGPLVIVAGAGRGPGFDRGLVAFDTAGALIAGFGTDATGAPVDVPVGVGAPGIADLDNDGRAEVFVGLTVFDHRGVLKWSLPSGGNDDRGPLTVAADLDGDSDLELVSGNRAVHHDGTPLWASTAEATLGPDGWPAIADFDGDGAPEIAVVANGTLRIHTATGGVFSAPIAFDGRGGPPTIGDADGDGVPDIAVASSNALTLYRVGDGNALEVLWSQASRDFSSNYTGSSLFDFEGDGRVEVIYADECYARVYDGPGDGAGATTVRFEVPNTSCTATEYPVVADVTGDGSAELVVVSNDMSGRADSACRSYAEACATTFPGYEPTRGVRVYRDGNDNWVATRPIWNQHAYHVTNVCDGRDAVCADAENVAGAIPRDERASWSFPASAPLNHYRLNAQLEGSFAAADLVVTLRAVYDGCPDAVALRVAVTNLGALGVAAGVPVTVRAPDDSVIATARTSRVLMPGASEVLSVSWAPLPAAAREGPVTVRATVDDDGAGGSAVRQCRTDNDEATLEVSCAILF